MARKCRRLALSVGIAAAVVAVGAAAQAQQVFRYVDKDGKITTQEPTSLQNWFPLYLDEGELTFDTFGKLISPKEGVIYSPFDPANGSNLINLSIDYGKFSTQFAQPFSVLSLTQDGFASGRLDGLEIDASGTIRANSMWNRTASWCSWAKLAPTASAPFRAVRSSAPTSTSPRNSWTSLPRSATSRRMRRRLRPPPP